MDQKKKKNDDVNAEFTLAKTNKMRCERMKANSSSNMRLELKIDKGIKNNAASSVYLILDYSAPLNFSMLNCQPVS